jgi:probable F420-dependent oxidoreductase
MAEFGRLGFEITDVGSIRERAALARWAEQRGFRDAWTAEITDPDAFVVLAAAALETTSIRLGTAVIPLGVRTVPHLAAAASSVCELAPGRMALGVGVSSETIVQRWNGVRYERPLQRARESIAVLRAVLAGERTAFDGEQVTTSGFQLRHPPVEAPPVILAALNVKMLELAGELADGVYLNFIPTNAVGEALAAVGRGAARAGRAAGLESVVAIPCEVTNDPDAAIAAFAHDLAFYMTAPPYQRALEWYGYEQEVERARAAWAERDFTAVRDSVTPRLVHGIGAFGPAEHCRERVAEFFEAGLTTVAISPVGSDPRSTLECFAR